jgi:rhamnulokinase
VETKTPITGFHAQNANWTNEGGYDGRYRFLKNITGMWIIQEIARHLARSLRDRYAFNELVAMAKAAPGVVSLIDPDDTRLSRPANMAQEIGHYSRETGQAVPETPGALVRGAYDSLSLLYR